jgi:5'-nucleotidase/UDP-sugar diphosphatase
MDMKKVTTIFLVFLSILLLSCTSKSIKPCREELNRLTILYINDYHGHINPFKAHSDDKGKIGGLARIATIVSDVKEENAEEGIPTLFLCAGDVLQGTPMSTVFKGEPDIICLNKMGLNAMVLGNHEFDYGQENLNKLRDLADFTIMGANVISEKAQIPIVTAFFTRNIRGCKINFLGLVTDDTPTTTHPKNVETLIFVDPIKTAKELLREIDTRNLTIAITHLGYEVDKKLAKESEGIDIIIGGHSHTKIEEPQKISNTIICQAYEYGEYVGRLDIEIEDGKISGYRGELIPVMDEIEEDSTIKEIIEDYNKKLSNSLKQVIGTATTYLEGDREKVRNEETNLGDLIADVARSTVNTDIALINSGSIRASIDSGDITVEEILTVLPFGGNLVTMKLKGSDILEILVRNAGLEPGSGGFLQVSGIRFEINKNAIASLGIGGEPIILDKYYSVATNDFLAAGGDGYETFKNGKNYLNTGLVFSDILIDYIKSQKEIDKKTDGRIKKD